MIWRLRKNEQASETDGLVWTANAVAGISTGLAVSVLGASATKGFVSFSHLFPFLSENTPTNILTYGFLLAWVGIGLLSLLQAVLKGNPDENNESITTIFNTIRNYGTVWIGMAISTVTVLLG